MINETPELQWFEEQNFNCRQCGKRGHGNLRGRCNEDYGIHCRKCADKRLANSKKVREMERICQL